MITEKRVSFAVKKLKDKKLSQKVRRLRDFCSNVNSYIETIIFKLQLRSSQLSPASGSIEEMVNRLVSQESDGKKIKITSIKVIYIHLRENSIHPKCNLSLFIMIFSVMQTP